jgi:NADPH:quinone reductase-like Zn-dependent oxidoreductase
MEIYNHPLYKEDIEKVAGLALPWEKLKGSSVMISGATGLLGSFLIDVIMHKNLKEGLGCVIYALGRNKGKAMNRFGYCFHLPDFNFLPVM